MKKSLFPIALILTVFLLPQKTMAQSNWEAGIRFGNKFSFEATLPLASAPRLHPAVYTNRFGIATYFDWLFAFSDGPAALKLYPGVGPEFYFENGFDIHAAGNFGIEYSFDFPLTIGLDWRPGIKLTESFKWKSDNWGFTARFRIGRGALRPVK